MLVAEEVKQKSAERNYLKLNNQLNLPDSEGNIQLDKDKEAVKDYFLTEINPNTVFFHTLKEKLDYLTENGYYEKEFLDMYDYDFIKDVFDEAYSRKFRFKSFMGAYKFYTQYALKTRDGLRYIERFEDRMAITALYLGQGDEELAMNLVVELIDQRLTLATPTLLNSGKASRGELVSCFLLNIEDNMESIGRAINSSLQLSKRGGGVGINLSNLRESGSPIKGIANASSGVVPVMKILEDSFSYANQLGQRNGAGAVYLNVFHPDIYNFLSTKKENADEKIRVKTLSLGLVVPDKYYELLKTNQPMFLFSPYDVEREYGKPFSYIDITKEYDSLVHNDNIKKYKINARELENEISKLQQESGYPYIVNIDTANRDNPIHGMITMSNLCSEILQIQKPSKLNPDLSYDEVGMDISCNLGSLNAVNLLESEDFELTVNTSVRALSRVSEITNIEQVPTVKQANDSYHSIGLGMMNLATAFAINKMHYGSPESIELTDALFRTVRFYGLKASNEIARETGIKFFEFEKSKYADGSYLSKKYIDVDEFEFKHESAKQAFKNAKVPTIADWKQLNEDIMKYGLYNSLIMAVAPTGSISYVSDASASIHPIINRIENRQEGKVGSVYYPTPHLSNDTLPYLKSAYDIDMRKVVDVYAAAQQHVDQGLSLTLFFRSDYTGFDCPYEWKDKNQPKLTTRDLNKIRNYAWTKGIKSIYYIRQFTGGNDRQSINECESCVI